MAAENKFKTPCSIVNNEMGKVENNNNTPLIFSSDNSSIQLDIAAEAFNDYFLVVVDIFSIEKVDIYSALLSLNNSSSQDFPDTIIIPITESEIIVHLHP
jgi:hypothetical protein